MYLLGGILDFFSSLNGVFYALAYLLGGVPFGLLYGRALGGVDVRQSGSGSIGATNVLRALKDRDPRLAKKVAILTMLSDMAKGAAIIAIARAFGLSESALWLMGLLAVLGHCYSPFLRLEGGKGVATGVGVVAMFLPLEAAIGLVFWAVIGKVLKISSLASLFGVLSAAIASFLLHPDITHTPIVLISIVIFYKHIPNILRLLSRTEARVL